jgi:hypothetical protein
MLKEVASPYEKTLIIHKTENEFFNCLIVDYVCIT